MKIGKQQSKIVMRQLPENYARHSFERFLGVNRLVLTRTIQCT